VTSATDRFKRLLANALERVCVLEAELEQRDERIADLEAELALHKADKTDAPVRMEDT
jgi:hypothetical protein